MDINKLRYFCVIAECGSIRKAAEILRISPPALSKAVGLLESELGEELLIPDGRGILVSTFGKDLAKKAVPLLAQFEELSSPKYVRSISHEVVRIGTFEVFSTYFLSNITQVFEKNTRFEIRELAPGELEAALNDNVTDLGLTYIPIPTAGVEHIKIGHVDMKIFGNRSYTSCPFDSLPFAVPISPIRGSPTKVQGLDGWPDNQIRRSIRFRVTMMESALELCRHSLAVAYLPSFVVTLHNAQLKPDFQLVPLQAPKSLKEQRHPVYIAKRKGDSETQALRAIAKAIRATHSMK